MKFKVGDKVRRLKSEQWGAWNHGDRVIVLDEIALPWHGVYFERVCSVDERIKELEFQLAALRGLDAAKKKAVERWLSFTGERLTVEEGGYRFTFGVE